MRLTKSSEKLPWRCSCSVVRSAPGQSVLRPKRKVNESQIYSHNWMKRTPTPYAPGQTVNHDRHLKFPLFTLRAILLTTSKTSLALYQFSL